MSERPTVSVLMTVYNAAPWLREAIDSIIDQTHRDWELIAVDNGSTDTSAAILDTYEDERIKVLRQPENIGRTPALRYAFELAQGRYIAVLDADDVSEPARLEKQIEFLDCHPQVSVVGTWVIRINDVGAEVGRWSPSTDPAELLDSLGFENPIVHSAAMYRADVARAVGGYPVDFPYAQDAALWLRLAERGPIAVIGEFLSKHRTLAVGMTRSKDSRVLVARDSLALLEYAASRLRLSTLARRRNREETTIARCRYAIALLRNQRLGAAAALLLRAIVGDPRGVVWNRVYRAALLD